MSARVILPVATTKQVRRYVVALVRRHPGTLALALGLHAVAAVAGLAMPRLLGNLVQGIQDGTTTLSIDKIALAIAGFVIAQSVLTRFAVFTSARLGEQVLAELREHFVRRTVDIPLSTVERAGTGDLLNRTSRDVNELSYSVRSAVPETMIAMVTALLTIGALLLVSPLLALPLLIAVPVLLFGTRWYLRRASGAYLQVSAAYSDVTDGLAETVEGARTVEAMRVGALRRRRTDRDIASSYGAERHTLFLRTVFFPTTEVAYILPVVATLLIGGWFSMRGWVTLGQVTAATLYMQQLIDPLDRLISWLDELQIGNASLARLLGISNVPADRVATGVEPDGEELVVDDVRYAYTAGRDVLHGVDLRVRPGERLAMVGPSGAGKSTLGRLIAGLDAPRTGTVEVGGAPLVELPLDQLRGHVALVTQEHHVFLGTLRDNVALARPSASEAEVRDALAAVDALDWALELPDGLDTMVGTGNLTLPDAQAQQLALARLVLADPHTLVLDEATSLIDPRAARHLERSLAAVLHGRTVIAIAHRLFSAHDADRVAVVEDGRITELGSHHELVAAGGSYAALWDSWHGVAPPSDPDAPRA
jgi:ABC-type multidrug transport system fused ATPase/permease subunit